MLPAALAKATVLSNPNWQLMGEDAIAGQIEASDTRRWFRFTDDIVIRVRSEGQTSRLDVRSMSRHGRSDLGVNAVRIRRFLERLRLRAGRGSPAMTRTETE